MSIDAAKKVFEIEEQGLAAVRDNIGEEFERAVDAIMACKTRLVVTGIGKSGIIGQKIAATLNSTGTSSFFLHPVEALHGDLGMVAPTDVVLAISYSGQTSELNGLLRSLKTRGNTIISMTGGANSTLAQASDIFLNIRVPEEACPLGLAPTTSTTATLAMGDALAVVLLHKKQFKAEDFRQNHPGGSLGERLKVRVDEVMVTGDKIPLVQPTTSASEAISVLNDKSLGAVLVVSEDKQLLGIITDGDVRRYVADSEALGGMCAENIMTKHPLSIGDQVQAADALSVMQQHEVTVLPVVSDGRTLVGFLNLHELLGKGEFRFLI
ncbi:MAG: KpsF/GutQ family sugar-phosphate isomerase [Desulfotalea sp.]